MSGITKKAKIILGGLGLLGISLVAYYFVNIGLPQQEEIRQLNKVNEIKKTQIGILEEKTEDLPQMAEDLIDYKLEIEGLKGQIPRYQNAITIMVEILRMVDAHEFEDGQVIMGELIKKEDSNEGYYTLPMTINYTTTYYQAAKLLEKISRSYHMATIDFFSMDNDIQDKKVGQGDQLVLEEYVRAQIVLSIHYIDEDKEEDHPNFMAFSGTNDQVFSRLKKEKLGEENDKKPQEDSWLLYDGVSP